MLDLVPLRRAGREMAAGDLQACLLRERREPGLPGPVAPAVGPAGVAGDQQPGRVRVGVPADQVPPAADGLHRERGGVVVGADVHEPGVRGRRRRPRTGSRARPAHRRSCGRGPAPGRPSGRHSRPACAYSPTCSFFLASTLITGCPAARCSLAWAAIYRNWASRSGCRLPSVDLRVGLGGEPLLVQQPPGRLRAAPVPLRRSARRPGASRSWSSTPAATAGHPARSPPPGPAAPAPARGSRLRELLAARRPDGGPGPVRRHLPGVQLRRAVRDRLPRRPGHLGHRADPAVPGGPRHRPQHQPPRLLIQHRQQQAPAPAPSALKDPRPRSHHHPGTRHAGNPVNFGVSTPSPGSTSEPRSTTINGATPPPGRDVRGIRDSRGAREGRVTPVAWPVL